MSALGWQTNPPAPGADPDLLADLRTVPTSLLSDAMSRLSGTVGTFDLSWVDEHTRRMQQN